MNVTPVEVALLSPDWRTCGGTSVRGQAHVDDRFCSAADLASFFDACAGEKQWQRALLRCNGSFAVVSQRPDAVLAAVDRVRSIPLFYRVADGRARISDSAESALEGAQEIDANPLADVEFQLTGYVTGDETLISGIHQVQAGEMLRWDAESPEEPDSGPASAAVAGLKPLVDAVRREKLALAASLQKAEAWSLENGELRLVYSQKDRYSGVQVSRDRETVIRLAATVLPGVARLRVDFSGQSSGSGAARNVQAEMVKKIFRGEVVKGE